MRLRMRVHALIIASSVVATIVTAAAIEQRPLPVFHVLAADGRTITGLQLSPEPQWLIVYVTADCSACDRLLKALETWRSPQLIARTTVIIGGNSDLIRASLERRAAEGAVVPAYSDAQGEARQALGVTDTPVLIAVRKGQIEWSISAVLSEPAALESVVKRWVGN